MTSDREYEPHPDDEREVDLDGEEKIQGPTVDPDERVELDEVNPEQAELDANREVE
ncbi:hypothetical protein [Parafrigoribacterium soli]|uniref:hypothetical protein n=1 Tax=Parafrigoribacterium soli TaxID=3144663 RepID=UPI0032EEFA70